MQCMTRDVHDPTASHILLLSSGRPDLRYWQTIMEFDKQLSTAIDLGSDRLAGRPPVKSMFQTKGICNLF